MTVAAARAFAARPHRLLVGGEWVESQGSEELPVEGPATEEQPAVVSQSSPEDADAGPGPELGPHSIETHTEPKSVFGDPT